MEELGFWIRSQPHPYCCGVDNIGGFDREPYSWESYSGVIQKSGTGLYTAEFIRTARCKQAYEWLCKTKKLVYQSPIRKNKGHRGGLFLCVFEDLK